MLQPLEFDDALARVDGLPANLVVFSSEGEKKFVDGLIAGDLRFFGCDDGGCMGPSIGYYQKPDAKRSSQGWVSVTGEPVRFLNWDKSTGQPNEMDIANAAAFATYGGPKAPAKMILDMIRFRQVGKGFIVEFPAAPATLTAGN